MYFPCGAIKPFVGAKCSMHGTDANCEAVLRARREKDNEEATKEVGLKGETGKEREPIFGESKEQAIPPPPQLPQDEPTGVAWGNEVMSDTTKKRR